MTESRFFIHPKLIVVTLLGFSSGLPRLLVAGTLVAMLTDKGLDTVALGLFANVTMPYAFHWAWAPLMDHLRIPLLSETLGRRVSWIVLSQAMVMLALLWMGVSMDAAEPLMIAVISTFIAFFSASQDIVIDAYRTEYLGPELYGKGAASGVFGYRLGMLVAGAGALALADRIPWGTVYLIMCGLMLIGMVTVLIAGEPKNTPEPVKAKTLSEWFSEAIVAPFRQFLTAHPQAVLILIFIVFYKMPDGFINLMTTRFFMETGFSKTEIAAVGKIYGFFAVIIGGFVGGALLDKIGIKKALLSFFILHLATVTTYILLDHMGHQLPFLILSITLDYFTGGMVTSALVALLMSLCNKQYTATQYALLGALPAVASTFLANGSGWVAVHLGWSGLFITGILLGLPALVLLKILWRNPSISLTNSR
ncbi:MAG: MFS transporter [Rickettsiales bacterium]